MSTDAYKDNEVFYTCVQKFSVAILLSLLICKVANSGVFMYVVFYTE